MFTQSKGKIIRDSCSNREKCVADPILPVCLDFLDLRRFRLAVVAVAAALGASLTVAGPV